jgi:transcriptional regulator with XRE-family HTH domain
MRITRMFLHRRRMGWTQRRLAEEIGVTQPRISAWETGVADIPPRRAAQIGEALGLDPARLTDEA